MINDKQGLFSGSPSRQPLIRLGVGVLITLFVLNLLLNVAITPALAASGPISTGQRLIANPAVIAAGSYSSLLNVGLNSNGFLNLNQEGFTPPRWSGNWADFGLFSAQPQQFDEPFNNLQADWTADLPEGTSLEVDLRASPDNQHWTLWQILDQSGQSAQFGAGNAFLYAQYRVRMFSATKGITPTFKGLQLQANKRDLNGVNTGRFFSLDDSTTSTDNAPSTPPPPPTYTVFGTREGLVGGRTANGHIIQPHDRFVSLPSWTALNDKGKSDYQVRIVTSKGTSAVAPVWDVGPWNFKDNYWHNPRFEFKDLPVGVPQAEKAVLEHHNNGLNESGEGIYNPSGIDIGDGTYWDDLNLDGASAGRLAVTFIWEGAVPPAATISDLTAFGAWHNGVQLKWNTNYATNTWVEYGLSPSYGQSTGVDNRMVSAHAVTLTDLVPGQTYHYRVHSKDIYGTEAVSPDTTFKTLPGVTSPLSTFQNDKGIGLTLSKDHSNLLLLGARVNASLWNDNPQEDYLAGAKTVSAGLAQTGNLDFDLAPTCDDKGQNCTMGFGTGYKNFVRFTNQKGETFEVGLIHDQGGLSPTSATLMVEGNLKGKTIRQYNAPNSSDQGKPHHFHFFWWEGHLLLMYDFGPPQIFDFNAEGLTISFIGAGRAQGDIVAAHFQNIAFSPNAIAPAQS